MDIDEMFDDDDVASTTEDEEAERVNSLVGQSLHEAEYENGVYVLQFSSGIVMTITPRGILWGVVQTH